MGNPGATKNRLVLLVDDEQSMLKVLERRLASWGCRALLADNGLVGVDEQRDVSGGDYRSIDGGGQDHRRLRVARVTGRSAQVGHRVARL